MVDRGQEGSGRTRCGVGSEGRPGDGNEHVDPLDVDVPRLGGRVEDDVEHRGEESGDGAGEAHDVGPTLWSFSRLLRLETFLSY